jgi:hypothetical protein
MNNEIIIKILCLPHDFKNKNKSQDDLLLESGYFEFFNQITEAELILMLKQNPEVINDWLQFSEDGRDYGWYFTKGKDGKCFVGHYPEGREFIEINTSDEFLACAAFIKRKIEDIRTR